MTAHRILEDLNGADLQDKTTTILKLGADALQVTSNVAPTDSQAGYAKGCIWLDYTNGNLHINKGTAASSTWEVVSST